MHKYSSTRTCPGSARPRSSWSICLKAPGRSGTSEEGDYRCSNDGSLPGKDDPRSPFWPGGRDGGRFCRTAPGEKSQDRRREDKGQGEDRLHDGRSPPLHGVAESGHDRPENETIALDSRAALREMYRGAKSNIGLENRKAYLAKILTAHRRTGSLRRPLPLGVALSFTTRPGR